jgi:hypothetical protein
MRTCLACALGLLGAPALACGQVYNPANGHRYQLTASPMSWPNAKAAAEAMGGTLAAFTEVQEWQWVMATVPFGGEFSVWLGGRDGGTGAWTWATGEPFTFAIWFPGPPVGPGEWFLGLTTDGPERGSWFGSGGQSAMRGLVEIGPVCYPNCDGSTVAPALNIADFTCFLQKFAAGDWCTNCDGSTAGPVLTIADFTCYLQRFAAGCSAP